MMSKSGGGGTEGIKEDESNFACPRFLSDLRGNPTSQHLVYMRVPFIS